MRPEQTDKAAVRTRLKSIRGAIADRAEKEARIRKTLEMLTAGCETIFIYVSMGDEPDTRAFIRANLRKTILVPLTEHGVMRPVRLTGDSLCADKLGNLPASEIDRSDYGGRIDVAVVPMLGFYQTYRVGYGGGYYDKFLFRRKTPTIGLCFDECACKFTPEPHDVPLDTIVTPERIIWRT